MEIKITMTPEQLATFNRLKTTRPNVTDQELVDQLFSRGLYDVQYRSVRNKQQWAEFKQFKATMKKGN